MAKRRFLYIVLLLGLFLGGGSDWARSQEEPLPFEPGEKLTYHLRWGLIPIGTARLWVRNKLNYQGREVYHLSADGRSNAFLSVFYKVDDLVQSLWDAEEYRSLAFQKIQNEGHYHINEIYLFNHNRRKVTWLNSKRRAREFSIPEGVQDAISCLYNFRRVSARSVSNVMMDVHQDEKNYFLSVESSDKATLKVAPLGKVKVVKVEPVAEHEGMFLRKGRMWVWFTDDKKRIPVMVKVKAPLFGKLTAELIDIETVLEPQPSEAIAELMEPSKDEV